MEKERSKHHFDSYTLSLILVYILSIVQFHTFNQSFNLVCNTNLFLFFKKLFVTY